MTLETLILACGMLTYSEAVYIMQHEKEYGIRAVACAVNRWKQEHPAPKLKTLEDAKAELRTTKGK